MKSNLISLICGSRFAEAWGNGMYYSKPNPQISCLVEIQEESLTCPLFVGS